MGRTTADNSDLSEQRPADDGHSPDSQDTQVMGSDVADDDPRLVAALEEYMAALESGRRPNRQEFLSRHAEVARPLATRLQALAFIDSAALSTGGGRRSGLNAIDAPAAETRLDSEIAAGQPLGDFKLLREIGRGGMGVVYEAMQLSLGRRVAVKVLSFAAALDPRHLQRFRNEAQAAAQLHHNNIVPVYSVGCERSVHFYAMQLIEGRSIAQVITEVRDGGTPNAPATPSPRPSLGPRRTSATRSAPIARSGASGEASNLTIGVSSGPNTRVSRLGAAGASQVSNLSVVHGDKPSRYFNAVARLGLQAAEALHYAHQKGVVHRDVKPANLLLDNEGNLWITDFGLAQFYDLDSGLTQTGNLLGTYRYMSPEQASGRAVVLDQRTDVYSLGITLYEMLTLQRALRGTTREQLLYEISAVDPEPPRSIDKSIPPELEIIIGKAIAKDPADRYASALAMAEDLGRFLRNEPIHARPPSLADKAVKWIRRHRAAALTAVAVLVLATAGLLISTLLIAREQGRTKDAYIAEQRKAAEADQSFKEAREAVDFLTRIASDEMANKPEYVELRRQLLEASLLYYQNFLDQRRDAPASGAGSSERSELSAARASVSSLLAEIATGDQLFRLIFRAGLLSQPSVRQALSVSSEQAGKIDESLNVPAWFGTFGKLDELTPSEKRDKYVEKSAEIESKLSTLLTPEQRERLQQIYLQVRGGEAFTDPDVSQALGLTRDQKEAIRSIRKQAFRAMHDDFDRHHPPGPPPGPPPADLPSVDRRPAPRDDRDRPGRPAQRWNWNESDKTLEKILALLTPAQLTTWSQMRGAPFTGAISRDPWGHSADSRHDTVDRPRRPE